MAKTLFTVELKPKEANLKGVRALLGIAPEQIDEEFGVVSIDPDRSLYTVLIDEGVVPGLGAQLNERAVVKGPFSNPRIEGFGPPTGGKHRE